MGEIKFVLGLVMTTIFAIAVVSFMINFGTDNQAKIKLGDDPEFSTLSNNLKTDMELFTTQTNSSQSVFAESVAKAGDQTMEGGGLFKINPFAPLTALYKILDTSFSKIFGNSNGFSIIFATVTTILGFLSLMYIYKTIWGKDPE
jgi:ABC-type sugar transport system permease subunit